MSAPTWALVLAAVNARIERRFLLQEPLPGGRQGGAWLVQEPGGDSAVLTWTVNSSLSRRRPETLRLVRRLCARGYPTPAWIDAGVLDGGVVFELAEYAKGSHPGFDDLPLSQLIEAIELQAGAADPANSSWSDYAWSVIRDPAAGRAVLARLGVMSGEVGQPGGWWLASEGGVGSVVIVEVEPAG